jgi:16S rRNA processing protein RimM
MTSRLHEIGRIGRARGLEGWVRILPDTDVPTDFFSESSIVYIKNERSEFRPLRVEDFYSEEKKNQVSFFVKFDMITDRTGADSLKDKAIFSDRFDPGELSGEEGSSSEPDVTGYDIWSDSEKAGHVLDLLQNPAHYILEVKTDSGTLLIPFVDEYIERADHEERIIYCRNLSQLMEE